MTYDPAKHHRRSIRLKGYNYSQAGLYFITICTQNRACLFGKIEHGIMHLNDAGRMVEKWYYELENKYPDKRCHEMVVIQTIFIVSLKICQRTPTYGRPNVGVPKTTNVGVPKTITASTIKNIMPPLAMPWIGLKQ